jgi:hypothetical protein
MLWLIVILLVLCLLSVRYILGTQRELEAELKLLRQDVINLNRINEINDLNFSRDLMSQVNLFRDDFNVLDRQMTALAEAQGKLAENSKEAWEKLECSIDNGFSGCQESLENIKSELPEKEYETV